MKNLDRHVPVEPLVVSAVDHSHPTFADFLDDSVVAETATDEVLHCQGSQRGYGIAARGA